MRTDVIYLQIAMELIYFGPLGGNMVADKAERGVFTNLKTKSESKNMNAEKLKFPVVAHHRIIVNAAERDDAHLKKLFSEFDLVEPITEGNSSAGGKYVSYSVSVRFPDRETMANFDERLKQVAGLKMVL